MKKERTRISISLSIITIGFCLPISAQNLVPNAGFEVQDSCPAVSEIFVAPPWNSPTSGTPDLFNTTCPSQQGSPNSGIGCAGVYAYSTFPNNREYIQVQLTSPLVSGMTYDVSFYLKRNTFFTYAIDRMGAYLSTTAQSISTTSALTQFTPQVENGAGMLNGTAYTSIWSTYLASGGEEYLLIGNFSDDANTMTEDVETNGNLSAYYYIDDIYVGLSTGIGQLSAEAKLNVFPNPSSGKINIEVSQSTATSGLNCIVTDLNGRVVQQENFGNAMRTTLDLSGQVKGIYMVSVYSNDTYIAHNRVVLE